MPDYGLSSATLRTGSLQHFVPLSLSLGCALFACHASGFCFVDLKPHNVILTSSGCCLVDGGSIRKFGEVIPPSTFTPRYCRTEFPVPSRAAFDMTCLMYTLYEIFSESWNVDLPPPDQFLSDDDFYEESPLKCLTASMQAADAFEFLCSLASLLIQSPQHMDYFTGRFAIWLEELGFGVGPSSLVASYVVGSEA